MTDKAELDSMGITELFRLLPHRYPFLLVDKIIDIVDDISATGVKNVTMNEPHFNGHFPGEPIMPGVLIIEAMAQTCGAMVARKHSGGKRKLVYFMTIDNAKFRRPVIPGDVLHLKVEKLKQRGNIFRFACNAYVEEHKAAEALISAMMVDPEEA
ncbi:MAG: 3-hydroxyacyl-ACP dehydratase FabZ [Rhizobiaceae bacterium]